MGFVRGVLLRWRALFRRAATEQELDDEIRHHLELEAEKNRALAGARAIRTLLYEVPPRDPTTFVTVSIFLALTALIASWLPALRASRADPAGVLRTE